MMITFDDFSNLLNGVWVSVKADGLSTSGKIDAECEDLAQLWSKAMGGQRFTGPTAIDIYQETQNGFYTQIPNTLTNYPLKGDLVIWDWPHVGICTGNNTNANQLEVLEQNDPKGSEVHIKLYPNYNGIQNLGWLRKA